MDPASALVSTATFAISIPTAAAGVRAYRTFAGVREVLCPSTAEAALVRIHATRAVASRLRGGCETPLKSCSRWPEARGCAQGCRTQIPSSTTGCRVAGGRASRASLPLPVRG